MVQGGQNLRLALETRQPLRVLGKSFRQDLDGDVALEPHVMRTVDFAHTPGTELIEDAVVGNGLADHMEPLALCWGYRRTRSS